MKQHSPRFLSLVNDTKKHIAEISAADLKEKMDQAQHIVVIDVREDNEWSFEGGLQAWTNAGYPTQNP